MSRPGGSTDFNVEPTLDVLTLQKSLISHPDRVPAGPGSEIRRKAATVEFQVG